MPPKRAPPPETVDGLTRAVTAFVNKAPTMTRERLQSYKDTSTALQARITAFVVPANVVFNKPALKRKITIAVTRATTAAHAGLGAQRRHRAASDSDSASSSSKSSSSKSSSSKSSSSKSSQSSAQTSASASSASSEASDDSDSDAITVASSNSGSGSGDGSSSSSGSGSGSSSNSSSSSSNSSGSGSDSSSGGDSDDDSSDGGSTNSDGALSRSNQRAAYQASRAFFNCNCKTKSLKKWKTPHDAATDEEKDSWWERVRPPTRGKHESSASFRRRRREYEYNAAKASNGAWCGTKIDVVDDKSKYRRKKHKDAKHKKRTHKKRSSHKRSSSSASPSLALGRQIEKAAKQVLAKKSQNLEKCSIVGATRACFLAVTAKSEEIGRSIAGAAKWLKERPRLRDALQGAAKKCMADVMVDADDAIGELEDARERVLRGKFRVVDLTSQKSSVLVLRPWLTLIAAAAAANNVAMRESNDGTKVSKSAYKKAADELAAKLLPAMIEPVGKLLFSGTWVATIKTDELETLIEASTARRDGARRNNRDSNNNNDRGDGEYGGFKRRERGKRGGQRNKPKAAQATRPAGKAPRPAGKPAHGRNAAAAAAASGVGGPLSANAVNALSERARAKYMRMYAAADV